MEGYISSFAAKLMMIVLYGNYCNQAEKALVGVAVACRMAHHLIYLHVLVWLATSSTASPCIWS